VTVITKVLVALGQRFVGAHRINRLKRCCAGGLEAMTVARTLFTFRVEYVDA